MKLFKRILAATAAGVMALAVFTGCSGTGTDASSYTIGGAVSLTSGGQKLIDNAPVTIVSDGTSTYIRYEDSGSVVEGLTVGSDYYERVYPVGTSGAKWSKSTVQTEAVSSDASVTTGTMTIDGQEYQYQTYDNSTYYCIDNGSLKYLYMKEGDEETTIRIDSLTTEIDASLLAVPADSDIEAAA